MGYFPNGTSWMIYQERYCVRCKYDKDGDCPVSAMHLLHNYEECNKDDSLLHKMIPRSENKLDNEKCIFFTEMKELGQLNDDEDRT